MIEARMQKARRLLEIHRNMQRLEEVKVASLRSREAELAAMQEDIVTALNSGEGLQGMFVPMIVRRLKSLGEEAARVAQELAARLRSLQTIAGRTKLAERRSRGYEQELAKSRAEKELIEIIERIARGDDASLP